MNERGHHLLRVGSNFLQLGTGFVIGLFVVRLLLTLGTEAYGVIAALTAGVGMAQLLREVTRAGLVPKLGAAWHGGRRAEEFPRVFRAALALGGLGGLLSLLAFSGLSLALVWLDIPPAFHQAARAFLWWKASQVFIALTLGPFSNALAATEQQVGYNLLLVAERVLELSAALWVASRFGAERAAEGIVVHGALVAMGSIVLQVGVALVQLRRQPLTRVLPWAASRRDLAEMSASFGWNTVQAVAMNLHLRLDVLLSNAWLGLLPGLLFSLAGQAASYLRQVAMGLVNGLDAVAARQRSRSHNPADLAFLIQSQTRLAAWVILPGAALLAVLAEPLLKLWLGTRLPDAGDTLPVLVSQTRLLLVGVAARAVTENWMAILSGAGEARRYAPALLAGAVASPVLVLAGLQFLPEPWRQHTVPMVFSLVFVVVHLGWLPALVSRTLKMPLRELFRPLRGPCVLAVSIVLIGAVARRA